jgi:hypothetical protein
VLSGQGVTGQSSLSLACVSVIVASARVMAMVFDENASFSTADEVLPTSLPCRWMFSARVFWSGRGEGCLFLCCCSVCKGWWWCWWCERVRGVWVHEHVWLCLSEWVDAAIGAFLHNAPPGCGHSIAHGCPAALWTPHFCELAGKWLCVAVYRGLGKL